MRTHGVGGLLERVRYSHAYNMPAAQPRQTSRPISRRVLALPPRRSRGGSRATDVSAAQGAARPRSRATQHCTSCRGGRPAGHRRFNISVPHQTAKPSLAVRVASIAIASWEASSCPRSSLLRWTRRRRPRARDWPPRPLPVSSRSSTADPRAGSSSRAGAVQRAGRSPGFREGVRLAASWSLRLGADREALLHGRGSAALLWRLAGTSRRRLCVAEV